VAKGSCRQAHARTRIGQTIHAGAGRPSPARPSGAWQGKVCKSALVFFLFLPSIASTMVAQLNYISWVLSTLAKQYGTIVFHHAMHIWVGLWDLLELLIGPRPNSSNISGWIQLRISSESSVRRTRCKQIRGTKDCCKIVLSREEYTSQFDGKSLNLQVIRAYIELGEFPARCCGTFCVICNFDYWM